MKRKKLNGAAGKSIPPKDRHPWRMPVTPRGEKAYMTRAERAALKKSHGA
jgi:hypothetical protein